jgi:phosphonate transport system substrate-binding protein
MNFRTFWAAFALSASAFVLSACNDAADEPLRIGMVPDAGATQVSIQEKAPLKEYLSAKLGRSVELIIPTNYNAAVEGIGNGSLDIAYFGGLTYAKAHQLYGVIPLAQRDIDLQFHSLFITRAGSSINDLKDLRGKTFCFGDVNSTSGHLMPQQNLHAAGLDPKKDFKAVRYTGSHPATTEAVLSGVCDAGSVDETVFKSLIDDGKVQAGQLRVFHTSQPFADYVWAARKDLPEDDQKAFADALIALRPGTDDGVLDVLRGRKYVPAHDESYKEVTETARELGLL